MNNIQDCIQDDGSLYNRYHYISWKLGSKTVVLDDEFTIDELEQIVLYIRQKLSSMV